MTTRKAQRGFLATALLMPIVVAALMLPMVAQLTVLKAEQARRDEEVRLMLAPKGKRVARPIADAAILDGEAEARSSFQF